MNPNDHNPSIPHNSHLLYGPWFLSLWPPHAMELPTPPMSPCILFFGVVQPTALGKLQQLDLQSPLTWGCKLPSLLRAPSSHTWTYSNPLDSIGIHFQWCYIQDTYISTFLCLVLGCVCNGIHYIDPVPMGPTMHVTVLRQCSLAGGSKRRNIITH